MKPILLLAVLVAAAPATAANLVVNGDFSAGNTGFASQYGYVPSAYNAGYPEGIYLIDTNAANVHNLWYSFGDHTTGTGNYMIVNGATSEIAGASRVVWSETITAAAFKKYAFAAFAANTCCNSSFGGPNSPSNLTFAVDDGSSVTTLGTYTTNPAAPGVWNLVTNSFTTGASGNLTLRIVNSNLAPSGNDFGLDDISLSAVPEPASWALLVGGFALTGAMARRRRATVAA